MIIVVENSQQRSNGIHSNPVYLSQNWWELEKGGGEVGGEREDATDQEVGQMQQTESVQF